MNDLRPPCETWAEPISLAAAGCLPPDEEHRDWLLQWLKAKPRRTLI